MNVPTDGLPTVRGASLLVGLVSGLCSAVLALAISGWIVRGWVDRIDRVADRVTYIEREAQECVQDVRAGFTEGRAAFQADISSLRADVSRLMALERSMDRRLTIIEERMGNVLRILDDLIRRTGAPPRVPVPSATPDDPAILFPP